MDRSKNDKLKAEESFPISEQGYTVGKLLDGTECQLFDENSYLSTTYLEKWIDLKMTNLKQKNLSPYQNKGTQ